MKLTKLGGITDHGTLTGLSDDDHTQYLLIDGSRAMSGSLNMNLNEILNFKAENVAVLPSAGNQGRIVYLTSDTHLYLDKG